MDITKQIAALLNIDVDQSAKIVAGAHALYIGKMKQRFSELRGRERIKRTNPFLLRIRGLTTVHAWAERQVSSALIASEEEATGHLLEMIAKTCHPGAREPEETDDLDYEVVEDGEIHGYQVKMSWDCMPMSSRKNLSNTIAETGATRTAIR